jgi:hypothetical protein
MSYLLLHNGNQLVKSWAANFYNCNTTACLVDPWPNASCLNQKYQLARTTSICTDLTTADAVDFKELFTAKQSLEIIKVITAYENDLANLEPVWNSEYNQQQWLISTFSRLSVADHVVFLQPVVLKCLQTEPAVIFTPGRSGTHVLKGITGIHDHLHHHDDSLLIKNEFLKLINAERILSIMRKQFVDQVISDAISNRYGFMLTTSANFEKNQQSALTWNPFDLSESDYKFTLDKICSYVDLLLGIRMFYHKQIEFSLLEDLHEHFDKITHIKNPYQSQNIISNYLEAVDYCNHEYQPIYNQLLNKIQSVLGTTVHHYD